MCEFIGWVKVKDKVLFLTSKDIKKWSNSKDRPKCPDKSEVCGHGAIRLYYGIKDGDGVNLECTDFSSPSNFPKEIVRAIKQGKMDYYIPDGGLLTAPAWAKYEEVKAQAWAKYEEVKAPALAKYKEVEAQALAKYEEVEAPAFWKLFSIKTNRSNCWQ